LERLTQRLLEDLDRRGTHSPTPDCVRPELLGRLAVGRLDEPTRERLERHLEGCLSCLDRLVAIRDDLQALVTPEEVSPRLAQTLDSLLGLPTSRPSPPDTLRRIRRALVFRVPAWAAAGATALLMLTVVVADRLPLNRAAAPESTRTETVVPSHTQLEARVAGVVSSVRDASSTGIEAHVVDVRDARGSTYVLFAWGRPSIRVGDTVEADAIFTRREVQTVGPPLFQGVATTIRKVR